MMSETDFNSYAGKAIRRGLILCMSVALVLYALGEPAWAKGLALGGLGSALNIGVMALLLPKAVDPLQRASWMGVASLAARYGIMALALGVCVLYPGRFAFLACAAGLFSVQLGLVLENWWSSRAKD